jgi:hypothetical protein
VAAALTVEGARRTQGSRQSHSCSTSGCR